jgi:hypothetical protein
MVGDDEGGVVLHAVGGHRAEADLVAPHPGQRGDVGIVVVDLGARLLEHLDDLEGRSSRVGDVLLVGHARMSAGAAQAPSSLRAAASRRTTCCGMLVLISPASSMKRVEPYSRAFRQVERVDGDAMAPEPRPGVEPGAKPKGLVGPPR